MFGAAVTPAVVLSCVLLAPVKVTGCDRTRDESAELDNDKEFELEPLTEWQIVDDSRRLEHVLPQLFFPFLDTRSQMSVTLVFTRYKSPLLDILTDRFIGSKKAMQDHCDTVRVLSLTDGRTPALFERNFDESMSEIMLLTPDYYLFTLFKFHPRMLDFYRRNNLHGYLLHCKFDEENPEGVYQEVKDFSIWCDVFGKYPQKPCKSWIQRLQDSSLMKDLFPQ